jgi:hypothetical protein
MVRTAGVCEPLRAASEGGRITVFDGTDHDAGARTPDSEHTPRTIVVENRPLVICGPDRLPVPGTRRPTLLLSIRGDK